MLETLQIVWFILWALLWAVYFVLDGFDLGLGSLLPCLGKSEEDRRIMYNAAGPFWDGNEVWLISAGGVTFAAFPTVYAVMFSALYAPLLLLLFALIFRAVSFEFRGKVESAAWRGFWDIIHFVSNLVPSILLGVAFANLFMGIPVDEFTLNTANTMSVKEVTKLAQKWPSAIPAYLKPKYRSFAYAGLKVEEVKTTQIVDAMWLDGKLISPDDPDAEPTQWRQFEIEASAYKGKINVPFI